MGYSNIIILCIVLQELHSVLNELPLNGLLKHFALIFKSYIMFLMRLPLNGSLTHYATLHCSSSATLCS